MLLIIVTSRGVRFSLRELDMLGPCFAITLIFIEQKILKVTNLVLVIFIHTIISGMCYIFILFSCVTTERLEQWARSRMMARRNSEAIEKYRFLIPQLESVRWGEHKMLDKHDIIKKIVGVRPKMGQYEDAVCMEKYLERVDTAGLQDPRITSW